MEDIHLPPSSSSYLDLGTKADNSMALGKLSISNFAKQSHETYSQYCHIKRRQLILMKFWLTHVTLIISFGIIMMLSVRTAVLKQPARGGGTLNLLHWPSTLVNFFHVAYAEPFDLCWPTTRWSTWPVPIFSLSWRTLHPLVLGYLHDFTLESKMKGGDRKSYNDWISKVVARQTRA